MLEGIGKAIISKKLKKRLKTYLPKAGLYKIPYGLYGSLFLLDVVISLAIFGFILFPMLSSSPIFLGIGILMLLPLLMLIITVIIAFLLYGYYEFIVFKRISKIEEVLPDFLQEVSVNLRAGMSFDKALWNSIEPEFGVLEKEVEIVAKKVMAGQDTEVALKEFSNKYDSALLEESIDLITVGLRSGGDLADMIDKIVENVKDASYLRKELIASIMSFIIFIAITAVVISPTLFALSFNLMQIIQSLGEKIGSSNSYGDLPFSLGYKSIDPDDFVLFSKACVIIISAISSIIIADLREGSVKAGLKYILVFIPISYLIYVSMLAVFSAVFGVVV